MEELNKTLIDSSYQLFEDFNYKGVRELLAGKNIDETTNLEILYLKGLAEYHLANYKEAIRAKDKILSISPNYIKGQYLEGLISLANNDLANAKKKLENCISKEPDFAPFYNALGIVYYEYQEFHKAKELYDKAIQLNPEYSKAYSNLGNALAELKDSKAAIIAYNKAIEINPNLPQSYYNLAKIHDEHNDPELALVFLNKAIEFDSDYAKAYHGLGDVHKKLSNYADAINYYQKALEINRNFSEVYNNLGLVFKDLKQYQHSIDILNEGIRRNSKFAPFYSNLGLVYLEIQQYNDAEKYTTKALEIDNNLISSIYNLGLIYYKTGNLEEAKKQFLKYISYKNITQNYFHNSALSKIREINNLIDFSLKELKIKISELKQLLLTDNEIVTHYTSLSVARELIFNNSKFRISEATFLNDTSEGTELFNFIGIATNDKKNQTSIQFIPKPFIGSFVHSSKNNDLLMWRMYGKENKEEAKGSSITFSTEHFINNLSTHFQTRLEFEKPKTDYFEEFRFYKVVYHDDQTDNFNIPGHSEQQNKELNSLINELKELINTKLGFKNTGSKKDLAILEMLSSISFLFKSSEYSYEKEVRIVVNGAGFKINTQLDPPKVFIELVPISDIIDTIILGPKIDDGMGWASLFFYKFSKLAVKPNILVSKLPYK